MNNQQKVSYYANFLEKKRQQAQERRLQKIRQQKELQEKKHKKIGNYQVEERLVNTEGVNDNVVDEGQILKVKRNTLIPNEFVVECFYRQQKVDAMASRDEIKRKNISALLNYYENILDIKDKQEF